MLMKFIRAFIFEDVSRSKPDPEVFLLSEAGVGSALSAGMLIIGVGSEAEDKRVHYWTRSLKGTTADQLLDVLDRRWRV